MKYFDEYVSNTYAGSSNQLYFTMQDGEIRTGRIFYQISVGGKYPYSLLFSNIIDSTFYDGTVSHKNLICDSWEILGAKIGKCSAFPKDRELTDIKLEQEVTVTDFCDVTFDGKSSKTVMPGEFFATDPIELSFEEGEYLCQEITYSGPMIPYHEETLLPVYVKSETGWQYHKHVPFASMIGCARKVKKRVAFFGDSITQGIGTTPNSYLHWNAQLSRKIGESYSFWNLGIGFGRANDAATDGAWFYKAKQSDIVFVCFGVNDLSRIPSEEQTKNDLFYIVNTLKNLGKTVILQTIPPFDYPPERKEKWERLNHYIKTELAEIADLVFDNVPYLGESTENPQIAKFGGHPNEEGCTIWADALYEAVGHLF